MCTTTSNFIGYVADRDIKCYKVLYNDNGKYKTPAQEYPVNLNSMLKPKRHFRPKVRTNKLHLGEGYIHAYTGMHPEGLYLELKDGNVFQAYIPKGTRFWLDDSLEALCAEQMFITDKPVTSITFDPSYYFGCITDVLLDNRQRSKMVNEKIVKGIFVGSNIMSVDIEKGISYTAIEDAFKLTQYGSRVYLDKRIIPDFIPAIEMLYDAMTCLPDINLVLYSIGRPLLEGEFIWAACSKKESKGHVMELSWKYIVDHDADKNYSKGTMVTFIK